MAGIDGCLDRFGVEFFAMRAGAVIGDPDTQRIVMMLPIEGDRWIINFAGINGEVAPTDEAGLLAFARSMASPVVARIVETSEALSEPETFRFPANQRRHVERMRRLPLGWVMLGDAVCSFDPLYGQGMTSAAQQAVVLGEALDRTGVVDRRFARRYFKAAGRVVKAPWSIAVGGDFAYPGTTGKKPPFTDLLNRYNERVTVAAQHDDEAVIRFNEVLAFLRPPESLLAPRFALRVWRASRNGAAPSEPVVTQADEVPSPSASS
jgi:hypothetical protein